MADLAQQVARQDAAGGLNPILESVIAGETSQGYGYLLFPPGTDLTGATGSWALLDNTGAVYAQGNATSIQVTTDLFRTRAAIAATVSAPSALPPSSRETFYQIRWSLVPQGGDPIYSFTSVKVLGLTSSPIGPANTVELEGDKLTLNLVTEIPYTVTCSVYGKFNAKVTADPTVNAAIDVAGGKLYQAEIDPLNINVGVNPFIAALEAYVVSWKATDSNAFAVNRFTAELFVVNSSMLSAMEDVRRTVMKARTTLFGFADTLFDPVVIMAALRRGRDMFNSASGILTEFTMTNATGGIREFWLRYSEVALLNAQALAEGEKAFNFQGAQISLDVDKAAVYREMADNLKSQLDADIKPFKQNLLKKGAVAGDGDMSGVATSGFGASRLGISVHAASLTGRLWRGHGSAYGYGGL